MYGYQLPKWLAIINLDMDEDKIKAEITAIDRTHDLSLDAPLPALKTIPSQSSIVNNNAINKIDEKWYQVTVQTNPLLGAQRLFPRGKGLLSQLLNELGASTVSRMDLLKNAQMILNMPTTLKAFDNLKL